MTSLPPLPLNQGKPVSKCCYQGVPWTTKNIIKITIKVLMFLMSFSPLGFAPDQFNFEDHTAGNLVFFVSDKHQISCHLTPTDVSERRIGCETE